VLQAIEQAAVYESREALGRNRWARAESARAFEAAPVAQRSPTRRTRWPLRKPARDAARDRGGVERREQWLFHRQGVAPGRCVVAEPAQFEQTPGTFFLLSDAKTHRTKIASTSRTSGAL
jgi:hypothetical protein